MRPSGIRVASRTSGEVTTGFRLGSVRLAFASPLDDPGFDQIEDRVDDRIFPKLIGRHSFRSAVATSFYVFQNTFCPIGFDRVYTHR
jgi:hypothetical protein